uniref:Serine carboxypeptidase S28 family protein n=1 Tax=Physcomitrium patens TaxID=3218 RepID=A0A7I4CCV6_PHYPA
MVSSPPPLLLLLFLLLPSLCSSAPAFLRSPPSRLAHPSSFVAQQPVWFRQRLDHFSSQDRREFQQRYYEFLDYFKDPNAPIFLRICGESTCSGIPNDYLLVLAKKFGAAVVSLEHRYYGESSPFEELTTDNLKYLSSKQALFDLASYRNFYQESINKKFNTTEKENPWIVFGVSYPGALSAWFRLKFPHLVRGSLSSSGVVLAVHNYTAFDQQVAASAGPACANALRDVTQEVDKALTSNSHKIKALFGVEQLKNDGDFRYLLADAAAEAFQYGNPDILCLPLVAAYSSGQNVVAAYAEFVKLFFFGIFGVNPISYDQEHLKLTKSGPDTGDRQWWYQVCTEVAYFQVAPSQNSIRSPGVNEKYHLDLCANVFGNGTYPEVDITNLYYATVNIDHDDKHFLQKVVTSFIVIDELGFAYVI